MNNNRRSQPYAFSVDGSSGELVAAGGTETETQVTRVVMMVMVMVMMVMAMVMVVVIVMVRMMMMKVRRMRITCHRQMFQGLDAEHKDEAVDFPSSGRNTEIGEFLFHFVDTTSWK